MDSLKQQTSIKRKICLLMIGINLLFWIAIAIGYSVYYWDRSTLIFTVMKLLIFLEPIFFLVILIGIWKKNILVYRIAIAFTFVNAILSITDEIGTLDIAAMLLSLLAFIALLFYYKAVSAASSTEEGVS